MQRHVVSKWRKTLALNSNKAIKQHIPHTKKLTSSNLFDMLSHYQMVYIKPDRGTYGNGVGRVEKTAGHYHYQSGLRKRSFISFQTLYNDIVKSTRGRPYLVQKGIHLLKHNQNRFDIRVMVQQTPRKSWETTGIIGRVAQPGKVVTNVHNGGKLKPIEILLSSYLSSKNKHPYVRKLGSLGLKVAHEMNRKFPGVKEIGVDVALDQSLHPWILEVNTHPDPFIFRKLQDKSIYRRIARYIRAYR